MDGEEPTQATQNVLDPRRVGKQNSGFSDEDISDIVCVLYPHSECARNEVQQLARIGSPFIIGKDEADGVEPDYELEDHPSRFESDPTNHGNYAILLRLSSQAKNPANGFVFGRNNARCDVVFVNDPLRRISNIHFRIYVNEYGIVMIEDKSTNGTFVDDNLLTSRPKELGKPPITRWTLSSGSIICIYLHNHMNDLSFRVRIPRRDGEYERAYARQVEEYFARHALQTAQQQQATPRRLERVPSDQRSPSKPKDTRAVRREWTGSGKYNRIGMIGKGAFAVVYKVTSKYDGKPYAAKELEKRRFIKNGVLDQKVENEMKIMRKVHHPNIVRYMENFDWDDRLLIIIMEFVPGGDLGKHIVDYGPFNEEDSRTMAQQLLSALAYLHRNNITHRDVKPDNILINTLQPLDVKLTDFGLSKMVDTEQTFLRTFCGTLLYCAPEVYTEYVEYNHAVDIWSLGGVLFYSMTGQPPYPVKSGISYSELLHKIMTEMLDIRPLDQYSISSSGIDFLCRMLQRRPENRATVEELDDHPWLAGTTIEASQSFDEITDDEDYLDPLIQYQAHENADEDDRVSDSMGEEEEEGGNAKGKGKENGNYTFGRGTQPRLFGEVGASAFVNSGAVPEQHLNLPVTNRNGVSGSSGGSSSNFESQVDEAYDSGDSAATLVKHRRIFRQDTSVSIAPHQSADQLQSLVEDVASQNLNGTGSVIRHVESSSLYLTAASMDFNTSKRKPPSVEASDEFDSTPTGKPTIKRLKSEVYSDDLSEEAVEECKLLARMPPIQRSGSGRQIDGPVSKQLFWEQDRKTWHLNYPEMTQLQYQAFVQAARDRGEQFSPGKTPLWNLAMKYFPPVGSAEKQNGQINSPIVGQSSDEDVAMDFPPTAIQPDEDAEPFIPDSQNLVVPGISCPMTDSLVSFGRGLENTIVYEERTDTRVPKWAFKILLWKEGYDPAKDTTKTPPPWAKDSTPDKDSYFCWISSKATNGIHINGHALPSSDVKNPASASVHWAKLYAGDTLLVWGTPDTQLQTKFVFRCFWGGSALPRPDQQGLEFADASLAEKLDAACLRTEKRIRDVSDKLAEKRSRINDAKAEDRERVRRLDFERERSHAFEQNRLEAIELLASRQGTSSRKGSPGSVVTPTTMYHSNRLQSTMIRLSPEKDTLRSVR
ncbi:protein kinase domain-containing protein [Trichoderma breve]|uniref:Autophagy-related protein 1 n=1 Tax=Trichoderma breve TaxID=2034170 RepID=A0A9W9E674_9HYPO|nr:protein kinase domain-containing protein [Trichoderma breve]KAJ4860538.1 protein kinase domain-containing protein [Trichoderma breve]